MSTRSDSDRFRPTRLRFPALGEPRFFGLVQLGPTRTVSDRLGGRADSGFQISRLRVRFLPGVLPHLATGRRFRAVGHTDAPFAPIPICRILAVSLPASDRV
jgi:hypothetical protein